MKKKYISRHQLIEQYKECLINPKCKYNKETFSVSVLAVKVKVKQIKGSPVCQDTGPGYSFIIHGQSPWCKLVCK